MLKYILILILLLIGGIYLYTSLNNTENIKNNVNTNNFKANSEKTEKVSTDIKLNASKDFQLPKELEVNYLSPNKVENTKESEGETIASVNMSIDEVENDKESEGETVASVNMSIDEVEKKDNSNKGTLTAVE